jgi:iron complex transport system ATP-binding protein
MAGEVRLHGKPLGAYSPTARARSLAVVLTGRLRTGRISCRSLISLARYPYTGWLRGKSAADERAVERAIEAVGIEDLAENDVEELSDGEFEKVMIARALAQEPEVMLLDEPAAFLDFARRVELMHLLGRLARERGMAVLVTSHDLDMVLNAADRVLLLARGAVVAEGAPEDVVLGGELEAVFAGPLVYFDMQEGSFRARREQPLEPILLHGSGQLYRWTARALQRSGFEPRNPQDSQYAQDPQDPQYVQDAQESKVVRRNAAACGLEVRVTEERGRPVWELQGRLTGRYTSLYELLGVLRSRSSARGR